ncbi:MAG TPA: S8 family serine peptidase [Candidatus Thalassarchaeaceae archaeon]|nr:S8 family serine peptidase [Candidatus Thalassarchaeaceae archaeon]
MMMLPLVGSIQPVTANPLSEGHYAQLIADGDTTVIPAQTPMPIFGELPWWEYTTLDSNRNLIHDSLETAVGPVNVGLSYDHTPTSIDQARVQALGHTVNQLLHSVDALLIGTVNASDVWALAQLDGVVMVERYGVVTFYGDVQTQAVKARNSSFYPVGAWDLGVSGVGVNIALTDTGVDSEHPGLEGKHVAGYDAVCFVHSDPACYLSGRETDGSYDPDDGNQHGTACMGMAAATGLEADGTQSEYYGSAPNASLVDVRIGTDIGAGPFENYFFEQDVYESALNGLQWIIDNKDTAWPGVDESLHGIDIISLSWGITSHESGGSDGEDMHSRILDEATEAGVTVSNAAGNDGEDNDGLSGMSASSLSITVGATDDKNTVDRGDDTIASYSSRGPRRDNGDNNPINELIPEVSAPGTNIIQAEGCVTSGGCSNYLSDASENTYTGRGSGTSYATPSVTGVIALVIEANPDLDPLQIKEVLKQTAERRGGPSAPDIDPYWNRDFGYGMVDAYEAVKLAQHLWENNQSTSIDPYLQNHLLLLDENTTTTVSGHSWAQQGVIDAVEFRIDGGAWSEATYEVVPGELEAGIPFTWNISLNPNSLSKGNHTVEVRAVSGEMTSLPVLVSVTGNGKGLEAQSSGILMYTIGFVVLVMLVAAIIGWRMDSAIFKLSGIAQNQDEILDAELVSSPAIDYSKMTNMELKDMLRERGLSVSGNKQELIDRLNSD